MHDEPDPTVRELPLPGQARPRRTALREYEDGLAKLRAAADRYGTTAGGAANRVVLSALSHPESGRWCRWRVQLDCGRIRELLTPGSDRTPHDVRWSSPFGSPTNPGEIGCWHAGRPAAPPWRRIIAWRERPGRDAAYWTVALECGHTDHAYAPAGWTPTEDAPSARAIATGCRTCSWVHRIVAYQRVGLLVSP